jgi:hypothetical protein
VFALRVLGDFRFEIFSTLHCLNVGLEMLQNLSAGRGLVERFVEIDFEITRLLTECLERFVQQVELLSAHLCEDKHEHLQRSKMKKNERISRCSPADRIWSCW